MTKLYIPEGYIECMQGKEDTIEPLFTAEPFCLSDLSIRKLGCDGLACGECILDAGRDWGSTEEIREVEIEVYIQPEESE